MAAYYHGGAGTDIQAGADGLQTLYLMNPGYASYGDAGASPPGATNMMLLNSAVSTMTPASFGHHHQSPSAAQQHFVGIPLQAAPSGYNLWTPATSGAAADMSPPQAQTPGAAAGVSAVLSLSSREAPPPVTVAAVAQSDSDSSSVVDLSPPPLAAAVSAKKASAFDLDLNSPPPAEAEA